MELPVEFVQRIERQLGKEEAAQLCCALNEPSPVSIRINPFKSGATLFADELEEIRWSRWGRYLSERPSFTFDSNFHAGVYYVQEASSQFIDFILRDEELTGCRILDTCAAPGGKATLYSSLVGAEGLVLANDIEHGRAAVLADNARKWGAGNIIVSCDKTSNIAHLKGWFDVVAVDAPCSGEGMFRKGDTARKEWSEKNIMLCVERQREILSDVWQTLRQGGVLIYSTCTFNRSENEEMIEWLSEQFEGEIEPYRELKPENSWGVEKDCVGDFQTFRLMPHKVKGEGLFVAVARKKERIGASNRLPNPRAKRKVIEPLNNAFVRECEKWLKDSSNIRFSTIAERIYAHHTNNWEQMRAICESINVIYSGVAMGQMFKCKLRPDHALAMYHNLNEEVVPCVELGDNEAIEYLRKATIDVSPFTEGFNLVQAKGENIGFAKRIGARVNNLYPNSLRIIK